VAFATEHDAGRLSELTPALLEQFLGSRARSRPKSFNHLRNAVGCLMDWAVSQELIDVSPLRTRRRRVTSDRIPFLFDPGQARRLLDEAGALSDNPRAARRGTTYRTMFALCYGLGRRAGEVCGLRLGDVDTTRALLVVRGGKFGKTRLVPHGPRIAALLAHSSNDAAKTTDRERGATVHVRRLATGGSMHRQPGVPPGRNGTRSAGARRDLTADAAQPAPFGGRRGYVPCLTVLPA
jgi:integrase